MLTHSKHLKQKWSADKNNKSFKFYILCVTVPTSIYSLPFIRKISCKNYCEWCFSDV